MERRSQDRAEAGRLLAEELAAYADREPLVLALPKGGVPVAFEVAQALGAALDVFVVRKLGHPLREELAVGAIASGGTRVLNEEAVKATGIASEEIEAVAAKEQRELQRRERVYRGEERQPDVRGRLVILVDDGLATGSTMRAAARALRERGPREIVAAVPTAPPEACDALRDEVDHVVCLMVPKPFLGVGAWYEDFSDTTDDEVRAVLARAERTVAS